MTTFCSHDRLYMCYVLTQACSQSSQIFANERTPEICTDSLFFETFVYMLLREVMGLYKCTSCAAAIVRA